MDRVPTRWFTYIAVDDVDAAVKATEERGGKVIRPPFEVPGVGRIAILEDPGGAAVGMMTPAAMPG
jgi:predicted enzyme related to lactoylglutathione lyase